MKNVGKSGKMIPFVDLCVQVTQKSCMIKLFSNENSKKKVRDIIIGTMSIF